MKVVICEASGVFAPRYDHTENVIFLSINDSGEIESGITLNVEMLDPGGLTELIRLSAVDILICGGMQNEWKEKILNREIEIIDNIIGNAGKVVERLLSGNLNPGTIIK